MKLQFHLYTQDTLLAVWISHDILGVGLGVEPPPLW